MKQDPQPQQNAGDSGFAGGLPSGSLPEQTENRLAGGSASGPQFWRSLDEYAGKPEFREMVEREFPRQAMGWSDDEDPVEGRRNFLKLMGASLALAGMTGCTREPTQHIVPYVRQPEELIPGRPLFYATAMPLSGLAQGLIVESHEGRPTKVEGNPEHPATLGACDSYSQGSVLGLYDPDRMQSLTFNDEVRSWGGFFGALREALAQQGTKGGAGLRILTETVTSPTMAAQMAAIQKLYPQAKWHQWEPAGAHSARAGAAMAFGAPVNTYYNVANANVIVALDADFLSMGPASFRYAREFAARRRVREGGPKTMNRLYVVEPTPTPTGTKADHRLPLRAGDVEEFAWALAGAVGAAKAPTQGENNDIYKWIGPIARDLQRNAGACLVIPGDQQSPTVHMLAHVMNQALGNVGKTVFYTDPVEANPVDQVASIQDLAKDLSAGAVDLLLIIGGNPAFNAPVELGFADQIKKARVRAHLSLYNDETTVCCQWHLPAAHYLESWGDTRAFDGTASIIQPLIAPLYNGRSEWEVVQMLTDTPLMGGQEIVKGYWATKHTGADFETWWKQAVYTGVVPDTAAQVRTPALRTAGVSAPVKHEHLEGNLEVIYRPDPYIYDGRFANNGWLQEVPRPITKMTWDNAALLGPGTAARLGVDTGDVLQLTYQGRTLKAPVWVLPGQVNGAATLFLGFGRTRAGRTGDGIGFNPYGIRTAQGLWSSTGLEVKKLPEKYEFALIHDQHALDTRREIIHHGTLEEYKKDPAAVHEGYEPPARGLTLYPEWKYEGYAWGMAIDLTACTGCSACVTACVAENNIPVVGKDQVRRYRNMHWLRVDAYYNGDPNNPDIYNQPVPCQQCENAPCELVCPVQATSHSSEGLNDMVYNRCVGTRYCSNNCPYKVRRFNFYLFQDFETPSLKLLRNPDVTVRSRGVMEKCTYCVQRINAAKIRSEREDRKVYDGEIETACQAACPTEAIVFGNINDPKSRVLEMKNQKLNYGLLADLNTRPRTTYLAALRNPNPEIEG